MSDISQIDGQAVRLKRETLGWASSDLATMACLSTKQVKQIEEGGISAFYSESVKLTAARKVAALLQMTEAQLFGQVAAAEIPAPSAQESVHPAAETALSSLVTHKEPLLEPHHASLTRSEALHFLAQPPENIDAPHEPAALEQAAEHLPPTTEVVQEPETHTSEPTPEPTEPQTANGNYMFKIFALFLVAIAVAALLRPKTVEEKAETANQETATPAPPPMQVPGASTEAPSNAAEAQQPTASLPTIAVEKPPTAAAAASGTPAAVSDSPNPAASGK